jgi:hypothetical protein
MKINGQHESAYGLALRRLSHWADGPAYQRGTTALPNVLGVVPAAFATTATREIECTFRVQAASLSEREAKLAAIHDGLAGLVTLAFDDHPTRLIRAIVSRIAVIGVTERVVLIVPSFLVVVTFLAMDSSAYDEEITPISFGATPVPIPMGTLPSPGVVFITGALSAGVSRTLTYRSFNGIPYGALTITPPASPAESLGANDWLELNLIRRTLIKVAAGVRTSVYHWKSSGAWFSPEPADSYRPANAFGTLSTDSGAAVYLYRRVWAL